MSSFATRYRPKSSDDWISKYSELITLFLSQPTEFWEFIFNTENFNKMIKLFFLRINKIRVQQWNSPVYNFNIMQFAFFASECLKDKEGNKLLIKISSEFSCKTLLHSTLNICLRFIYRYHNRAWLNSNPRNSALQKLEISRDSQISSINMSFNEHQWRNVTYQYFQNITSINKGKTVIRYKSIFLRGY